MVQAATRQDREAFRASDPNQEFFPLAHTRYLKPGKSRAKPSCGGGHCLLLRHSHALRMAQTSGYWWSAQGEQKVALQTHVTSP